MNYHFYLFSFYESTQDHTRHVSVSFGVPNQRVTKAALDKAREGAAVGTNATLLSVSYLGYMTQEEFDQGL
ncbi:hypothetical protein [Pseudomonas sp. PNPG3]|uniref:hypothetical protein n=1 Tax=Pseudomonas sp. PNPG3 TaxID=2919497 RepID=UPI001FFD9240|nr:hypothetical protein [Pseudomonas sp. PNPG3]MCK2122060.1 hypothetical protein [Pseudomonas sp. PNPG3]